jgi:hypothetical protein
MEELDLALISGTVLSLFFSYIPGLNAKFAALRPEAKRLAMAGMLLVVSVGVFSVGCWPPLAGPLGLPVECSAAGAASLVRIFFGALVANQAAFLLSPETRSVKEAKALSKGTADMSLGLG